MSLFTPEPKRNTNLDSIQPYLIHRVEAIIAEMQAKGYDPIIFEAARTRDRQRWLYGVGRTHSKHRKPVTWTLNSMHILGKAVDIISKSRGWNWPEFYDTLALVARKHGMTTLEVEQCHVEWRG